METISKLIDNREKKKGFTSLGWMVSIILHVLILAIPISLVVQWRFKEVEMFVLPEVPFREEKSIREKPPVKRTETRPIPLSPTIPKEKAPPPPILEPTALKNGSEEKELSVIGTRQVREIEKGLSWLSLIATIAPLLGLTGTVTGMIKAFMVIAGSSAQVSPSMLAAGIWEALITTAAGLLVAIPIHIGHHYLEKQADEIAFALKEITLGLFVRRENGV